MRTWQRPALVAGVLVLAVLAATGITLAVTGNSSGKAKVAAAGVSVCEQLAVPGYFSSQYWDKAIHSTPPPADIILDVSGVGAGPAPVRQLQKLVRKAQAAGITVLGYSSTVNGQRPLSAVEADVRHYAKWYGVTSIFLDRVSGQPAQVPYYKKLAGYIHNAHQGAKVWLNPGVYPEDRAYMSIGDVVLVFEGTYKQYRVALIPAWVQDYPAAKFAQNIFATPQKDLLNTLKLAKQRRAGHVYVTELTGGNPYLALPSYWAAEVAGASAGCGASG